MKTCTRCKTPKSLSEFTKRSAAKDGLTTACTSCLNAQKQIDYAADPRKTMDRVKRNFKIRREADPVYRQAWNQWHYAKSLGRVPAWVSFSKDILPKCRELLLGKDGWTIDHIVPLRGAEVTGFHVPSNLQALPVSDNSGKGNSFNDNLLKLHDFKSQGTPGSNRL